MYIMMEEVTCVHYHHFTSTIITSLPLSSLYFHMDTASAECPSNSTELTKKTSSIEDIFQPHDYVRATTEDGKQCLVPQFLIDEYEHMQKSLDNAKKMGVDQASGGVSGYCCPWTCSLHPSNGNQSLHCPYALLAFIPRGSPTWLDLTNWCDGPSGTSMSLFLHFIVNN
jgi:hypothetical protein